MVIVEKGLRHVPLIVEAIAHHRLLLVLRPHEGALGGRQVLSTAELSLVSTGQLCMMDVTLVLLKDRALLWRNLSVLFLESTRALTNVL